MRMTFKRLALLGGHLARAHAGLVELSPARLDFVLALADKARCQRELAEMLCVSEPVISRMVRALARLGLVQRHIPVADRRFRVVSLTVAGRNVLDILGDHELPMSELDVDCQGLSESGWLYDWREPLEDVGLTFLSRIADGQCTLNPPPEPPYAAMRAQHRSGVYRDFYGTMETSVRHDSPWRTRIPRSPRLHRGLVLDMSLPKAA